MVSPFALNIAAAKLYIIAAGTPAKYILKYLTVSSITSFGVSIKDKSGLARNTPRSVHTIPQAKAVKREVSTVFLTISLFFPPIKIAATTLAPTERPIASPTMRLIREVVEPTAAREFSPAKRPTTIKSAALNKVCKRPVIIRGITKIIKFLSI